MQRYVGLGPPVSCRRLQQSMYISLVQNHGLLACVTTNVFVSGQPTSRMWHATCRRLCQSGEVACMTMSYPTCVTHTPPPTPTPPTCSTNAKPCCTWQAAQLVGRWSGYQNGSSASASQMAASLAGPPLRYGAARLRMSRSALAALLNRACSLADSSRKAVWLDSAACFCCCTRSCSRSCCCCWA
jgi:hypothetical protein